MRRKAKEMGIAIESSVSDGNQVEAGAPIAVIAGTPKQVSMAEDCLIGLIAKTSGIATAARRAVILSRRRIRVVSGGWKKVPYHMKEEVREAIRIGGAGVRLVDAPFVYLDKNYVRMFGSVSEAVRSASSFEGRVKAVQVRGETREISEEAIEAAEAGAGIVMVDTGNSVDLEAVSDALRKVGLRRSVKIAFGGSIGMDDIPGFIDRDVDILDVGRSIIDAPMLDIGLDVRTAMK